FRCGVPEASDTIFQPTTHNSCSLVRLTGSLAVPALLYVVVKPIHAALSRQRSRVRVSSSPPYSQRSAGSIFVACHSSLLCLCCRNALVSGHASRLEKPHCK